MVQEGVFEALIFDVHFDRGSACECKDFFNTVCSVFFACM